jgi:hypothetical protein
MSFSFVFAFLVLLRALERMRCRGLRTNKKWPTFVGHGYSPLQGCHFLLVETRDDAHAAAVCYNSTSDNTLRSW